MNDKRRYTVRLERAGEVETIHGLSWAEADAVMVRAIERDDAEVSWVLEDSPLVTPGELARANAALLRAQPSSRLGAGPHVARVEGEDWNHSATCTCGWVGTLRASAEYAYNDAEDHLSEQAPNDPDAFVALHDSFYGYQGR